MSAFSASGNGSVVVDVGGNGDCGTPIVEGSDASWSTRGGDKGEATSACMGENARVGRVDLKSGADNRDDVVPSASGDNREPLLRRATPTATRIRIPSPRKITMCLLDDGSLKLMVTFSHDWIRYV